MDKIIIEITGKDIEKVDGERLGEYVFTLLCDQFDVTVTSYDEGSDNEHL